MMQHGYQAQSADMRVVRTAFALHFPHCLCLVPDFMDGKVGLNPVTITNPVDRPLGPLDS